MTGTDAEAHAQFKGNIKAASWHWQVDANEAVQSFEHYWACWAAGMEIRFGWIAYVVRDGDKFRVKTGTFANVAVAQSAENKIKVAKLAQVIYILDA